MNLYVGVTDNNWYEFLQARPDLDEVNFWQPSGSRQFRPLQPGDPFLFKLHHPNNFIVGGGMFAHASLCPIDMAWDAFAEKNGVGTLQGMRRKLAHYRKVDSNSRENFTIGCIILESPFFFPRDLWIPCPNDFAKNVVQGKTYDATIGNGLHLWSEVQARLVARTLPNHLGEANSISGPMRGEPRLVKQRLGQGAFRVLVADTYERRCAVTREKTLPVLQAAHIRPVTERGEHRVDNGLLLRSDVHTLFDKGYLTITPDYRLKSAPDCRRTSTTAYTTTSSKTPSSGLRHEPRKSRTGSSWSGTATRYFLDRQEAGDTAKKIDTALRAALRREKQTFLAKSHPIHLFA